VYENYLTKREKKMIEEIKNNIINASTVMEVKLYKEQIGLILERIIIRRNYERN
jgi:hypothetical protein